MGDLVETGALHQPRSPISTSTTHSQPQPSALHLAAYICFFYYHLVWDYVVTGFQLELYNSHEWAYAHVFIMTIQRSFTSLLTHIMNLTKGQANDTSASAENVPLPSPPPKTTPNAQATSTAPANRRRRRGGKYQNKATGAGVSEERAVERPAPHTINVPRTIKIELPSTKETFWRYQVIN